MPNNLGGGQLSFFHFFANLIHLLSSSQLVDFLTVSTPQFTVHTLNFPSVYTPMFVRQFSRNSYFLLYLNIASKDILIVKKVLIESTFLQKYLQ